MRLVPVVFALAATVLVGGCASSLSGSTYSRDQARTPQSVEMAVVEHVREVQIEGTKSGIGAAAGAVAGGVAGSNSRSRIRSTVGGVAGGVLGGMAGAAAEEVITRQKGLEITVRTDSGRTMAIVQAADEDFKVGERVRIVGGGNATRVTH